MKIETPVQAELDIPTNIPEPTVKPVSPTQQAIPVPKPEPKPEPKIEEPRTKNEDDESPVIRSLFDF